jgi:hypothetical protein
MDFANLFFPRRLFPSRARKEAIRLGDRNGGVGRRLKAC